METTINGIKLWYDSQGKGEPLVVTGGFALAHYQFEMVTPHLANHCNVINWDYEGTGFSDRTIPQSQTIDHWVEQLRGLLDTMGIRKTSLWGTANGALIVLLFAARYPERVNKIISHPWYKSDNKVKRYFQMSGGAVEFFGFLGFLRMSGTGLGLPMDFMYSTDGQKFDEWRLASMEKGTSVENYRTMCDLLGNVDLSADMAYIQAPTLLLMGQKGPLGQNSTVDPQAQYLLNTIPNCQIQTIPEAGGTLFTAQKAEEAARIVLDFLNSI